ncbi:MAG: fluoride efflux transporter CrcB [Janthinobacterium lividum]
MPALLLVMLGGAIGAGGRHLVGRALLAALGAAPWGTFAVNVTGGLAMGLLAGSLLRFGLGEPWRLFLGVGVLGGYTTFSSFSLDTVMLIERGQWPAALGYVLASVVGSIAALFGGLALTRVAA